MKFIRYGSLVPQDHDISDGTFFHTPPVERGIYAFPEGFVEPFLLGGIGSGSLQNGRYSYLKDENGNRFIGTYSDFYGKDNKTHESSYYSWTYDGWLPEWEEYFKKHKIKLNDARLWVLHSTDAEQSAAAEDAEQLKDTRSYSIVVENKPRRFTHSGNIWHHFTDEPEWVQFVKPCDVIRRSGSWVETDIRTYKKALEKFIRCSRYDAHVNRDTHKTYDGPSSGVPLKYFDKDWCEVFIEEVI